MLIIDGIKIQVVRKNIKNLYFRVYAKNGKVSVSAPHKISNADLQSAVISKLNWIKTKQIKLQSRPPPTVHQFITGESHYFFGKAYVLLITERRGKYEAILSAPYQLQLFVRPNTSRANKKKLLDHWYRTQLQQAILKLLEKWQPIIGKHVSHFGIKKMRSRWGSCNVLARRIWLNFDLVKKDPIYLEYVLIHELTHLHERKHNAYFKSLMDKYLPEWRSTQKKLNQNLH